MMKKPKTTIALIIFAGLLTGYAVLSRQYKTISGYYRTGKQLAAEAVKHEQHPAEATAKILIAGDSIMVGTGASSTAGSIAGRLGTDYPGADITNVAVNGQKVAGLVETLQSMGGEFDLAVVTIGGNDVVRLSNFSEVEKNLTVALELLSKKSQQVIVLTSGDIGNAPFFPQPFDALMRFRTKKMRTIFLRLVPRYSNIHFVDLFQEGNADPFLADVDKFYAGDKFHPSADGYGLWYEQIKKIIIAENIKL